MWQRLLLGEAASARRTSRRLALTCIVLAVVIGFFAPVARSAGTETSTLRWLTTTFLAVSGLVLYVSRGRVLHAVIAVAALVVGSFVVHANWLSGLAFVIVFVTAMIRLMSNVAPGMRLDAGAEEDRHGNSEGVTDVLESIATAFVLALIVREFAFEAFKIPTGSMEPTIYGEGWGKQRSGDRLLAAKGPLLFADPQRWSIVVFKYPLFRPTNYIKRLVGLPGELLQNRRGDIYVNGKVVAKPEEVQETLWFPIAPSETGEWMGGLGGAFTSDGGAKWDFGGDVASGNSIAERTGWIIHDTGFADVRASCDVDASGGGTLFVRLDGDGRRVELEARRDGLWLTAPGIAEKRKLDAEGLGSSPVRLGFAVADRVVRVYLDGRLVARVDTADESNVASQSEQVAFGVTGGSVKLSKIKLEHDLQYSMQSVTGSNEWPIPADSFFMLGDNTNSSKDSRLWKGSVFRLTDGRKFVADDSVRLDDEHSVTNIRTVGDAYEFYDSYGVRRHVEKAELVGGEPTQKEQPFVRRADLVGRAFLIFWPLRPEWRPRILP